MLKLEDIRTWLAASPQSVTEPISLNVQPDTPDTVITLRDTGGFALEVEDAFDNPTVQIRCRGPTNDADNPRDLAFRIDGLLLNAVRPFSIGSTRVIHISRLGGRPSYLETDEGRRTTYVANYTLKSVR